MIAVISQVGLLNDAQRLDAMKSWVVLAAGDPAAARAFELLDELKHRRRRSKAELLLLRQLQEQVDRSWSGIQATIFKIAQQAGLDGVIDALNTGLVELDVYPSETDAAVKSFFKSVSDAVLSPRTYPLFDEQTGSFVASAMREGIISPTEADRMQAKVASFASEVLQRLPLFEQASIEEILAIRHELEHALVRFRSAIIAYSRLIANPAWEPAFAAEAELVFREEVETAVLEIEEQVASNTVIRTVMRKATSPTILVVPGATSVLGVIVSTAADFSHALGTAAGFAAGAALFATAVADEFRTDRNTLERHKLYFYYGARRELTQRVKQ
ncbi:MAG: hypothetical protein M3P30_11435 [Chloroflexota bacterium]|nr:hypothetical protein [Chloroflexota bacterium]